MSILISIKRRHHGGLQDTQNVSYSTTIKTTTNIDKGGEIPGAIQYYLHGFEGDYCELTWNDSDASLSVDGVDWLLWNQGTPFTMNSDSVSIDTSTIGIWYIFYNSEQVLTASTDPWDLEEDNPVALVDWDGDSGIMTDNRYSALNNSHILLSRLTDEEQHLAKQISLATENFSKNLGSGDVTVQIAMETLDQLELASTYLELTDTIDESYAGLQGYIPVVMGDQSGLQLVDPTTISALQGPQGDQGNQGFQGADSTIQGPQGNQGDQGTQGLQGYQGDQGNQGNQGPADGAQGPQGYQGDQGNQGNQGDNGAQGNQGYQGDQGNQFEVEDGEFILLFDCPQSYAGQQGKLVAVKGTQDGLEFIDSAGMGEQGNQGNQGDQGPQGDQGNQGVQGQQIETENAVFIRLFDAPQSYSGQQGKVVAVKGTQDGLEFITAEGMGDQGPQGNQGDQGAASTVQGPQGNQGNQGPQGGGEGSSTYLGLQDTTDTTYSSKQGSVPMVNGAQDALELMGSQDAMFTLLNDVPASYSGQQGKVVAVKGTQDGLEFIAAGGGNQTTLAGLMFLLTNDETASSEHATSVAESSALKTYSLGTNTYSKIKIEAEVRSRVEADAANAVDFSWRLKAAGATAVTRVMRIIGVSTTGVDSGGRYVTSISTIIAGNQGAQSLTITAQQTVSNAAIGSQVLAFRVYGIKDIVVNTL